jgi:hypothetical protein
MGRYYVHDLESDKLQIHTGGKAEWQQLAEADRQEIKRGCLWSNSRGCWVSRALAAKAKWHLAAVLGRLGFEDRGTVGERLTFAEKVEAQQERAETRAERSEDRAQAATAEAKARFNSHNIETLRGMQGEPVKIGHHSEGRHRRLIEKADNDMRKGCEALDKAKHYERRAEAARATAEGKQYSDPAFLGRRIKEQEAEERDLLRRMEGKGMIVSGPPSEEYRQRLAQLLEDVRDKLGFYRHCLETCGQTVYTRETLKGKKYVLIRGRWEEIVRLNPTTVAVPNICFPEAASQRRWALKYIYAEVKDAK